jgi:hypothetical protein
MPVPTDQEKALKAFIDRFNTDNAMNPPISSIDPAEIAELVAKGAPAGTAQKWLAELFAIGSNVSRRPSIGLLALAAGGAITGLALIYGIFISPSFLTDMAQPGNARGLITFLFAFATIAVVIITVIATFWAKIEEVEKRGTLAKEILAILIGIMGTILGFYFGSAKPEATMQAPAVVTTPAAPTQPAADGTTPDATGGNG